MAHSFLSMSDEKLNPFGRFEGRGPLFFSDSFFPIYSFPFSSDMSSSTVSVSVSIGSTTTVVFAAAAAAGPIRVRTLLSSLEGSQKTALKKLLPAGVVAGIPAVETARYPAALLGIFPKDESYSLLGCVTEELLRLPVAEIGLAAIHAAVRKWYPAVTPELLLKVSKSKTTDPFLENVRATRLALDSVVRGSLRFDTEVDGGADCAVQGHPDAQTETQLFEVKMTGLLSKNWVDFLFQVFAYGALHPAATDVYLVLPLQRTVWSFSLAGWTKRAEYRAFLRRSRRAAPTRRPTSRLFPV
jgi:hypothetical protein